MRRIWTTIACVLAIGALACEDDDNGAGPDNATRVSVLLTDAPGDVQAAVVTISEIYLQGGSEGRVTLLDDPVTVNLIDLANETTVLLDGVEVEQGTYGELRFVVTGGYLEVETESGSEIVASSPNYSGLPVGATVNGVLHMPSLGSSGLKVDFDESIEISGGEQTLLVDFDVSQSFGHEAGNSGRWIMHPVVKGASATEAATVTITLGLGNGVVLPAGFLLSQFKAKVGSEELAFTDANSDGTFEAVFQFLLPGLYSVTLVGPAGLNIATNPVLPVELDLDAGESATQGITITSATVTVP